MSNIFSRLKNIYSPEITNISVAFSVTSLAYFIMKFTGVYGLLGIGFGFPVPMEADLQNIDPRLAPEINPWLSITINLIFWYIITSPLLTKVTKSE